VFDRFTALAGAVFETPIALISFVDESRQWFKSRIGFEPPETPREDAFCAHAIQGDAVFVVPDAAADPRFADNPLVTGGPAVRFYAGAPLLTPEGANVGALCVMDRRPRDLDGTQRQVLADLAALVVRELELRRRDGADGLTGACSRPRFLEHVAHELRRARRYGRPLSVLALDVDRLGRINERHGREAGDRLLRQLSDLCRSRLREQDVWARPSGGSFAVLLPETDSAGAAELAERLRAAVEELSVPAASASFRPTVSLGIAVARSGDAGAQEVLRRATAAVAAAKRKGGNGVGRNGEN
ncbi:MAG TPA: sensor domain-containing diguanylate cyclase, partial [Alphaproteobacteria bacterium]|nr:sensor domain-containing diguanylate cyclase [Alphaproteobacteria bacterium]